MIAYTSANMTITVIIYVCSESNTDDNDDSLLCQLMYGLAACNLSSILTASCQLLGRSGHSAHISISCMSDCLSTVLSTSLTKRC